MHRETPRTVEAAAEVVRKAARAGTQAVPVGGGTKRHWVSTPVGAHVELDMTRLDRVVAYSPEDMTVTVEAGTTLGALQQTLAEHHQRVTLDPPHAERATIGGILAANDSGPTRLAYGTARDVVIGMSMIEPDGTVIKSGGRVVKNVAGYDLHKLYIASFGTLGPIATVTFKLRPVPEARGLVVLYVREASEAERAMATALAGETRPTFIELLNARASRTVELESRLALVLGFEENADAVRWQCERVMQTLGGTALSEPDSDSLYRRLVEATGARSRVSFKATMLSSDVAGFVEMVERTTGAPVQIIAHAGSGIAYGLLEDEIPGDAWQEIARAAVNGRGSLHIRGPVPAGMRRITPERADAGLSDGIRRAFDPHGVFAPQRVM